MSSYTPSEEGTIDITAESLPPALKERFDKAALKSIKDLVDRGPIYVSKATGLDFEDAEQLCKSAASKLEMQRFVSKPFHTAAEFDENRKKNLQWISTGSKCVDSIFGGNGIETGAVRVLWCSEDREDSDMFQPVCNGTTRPIKRRTKWKGTLY
jgi:hypothetical protein